MKKELQEKLYEKYDWLFKDKDLPMTQTCMCWGLCVGDGWYDLLEETCRRIAAVDPEHIVVFDQVKEKFGGLRIYYHLEAGGTGEYDEPIFQIINEAEDKSYKICEVCGKPGTPNNRGWITTLCEECRNTE